MASYGGSDRVKVRHVMAGLAVLGKVVFGWLRFGMGRQAGLVWLRNGTVRRCPVRFGRRGWARCVQVSSGGLRQG